LASIIAPAFLLHAKQHYLPVDQETAFVAACYQPLRKSIRVNRLKNSVSEFKTAMADYGLDLLPIPWCDEGFWIQSDASVTPDRSCFLKDVTKIGLWPEHLQGRFYIQEASSMLPPIALLLGSESKPEIDSAENLLQNQPRLLDMAAAPGSKTTQIAAMLNNQGLVLANELSASRLKGLQANLVRCGVTNVCLSQFDGRKLGARLEGLFDFVLLDAPCGGEGTVRKDPSALSHWRKEQLAPLAKLQKELIASAYRCLKPGGRLVYSTCSLSPEENQQVVQDLVNSSDAKIVSLATLFSGAKQSLTEEGFLHVLPHIYDSEGFFVAAVTKPLDSSLNLYPAQPNKHFEVLSKKLKAQLSLWLDNHFGLDLKPFLERLMQRDKEIWLFPEKFESINQVMRLNRSGIKIADCYPNKFRLTHEFASGFSGRFKRQKIALDLSQTRSYYQGKDLSVSEQQLQAANLQQGEVVLFYKGSSIGLANLQSTKIKNRLPRDRVIDRLDWL